MLPVWKTAGEGQRRQKMTGGNEKRQERREKLRTKELVKSWCEVKTNKEGDGIWKGGKC